MKPQRFEIGQAVTPNTKHWQAPADQKLVDSPPKFGEVYHVYKYVEENNKWWIILIEKMKLTCLEDSFDPVISNTALEKELSTISEPQTA